MLLENKVAVIYGAGGGVGSSVAKVFAREGAKLYLTGRNLASVAATGMRIEGAHKTPHAAEVDALNERAIEDHLASILQTEGRVDISFNAVGIRNTHLQGKLLTEIDANQFLLPIETYARSYFLTSRIAARQMIAQSSGVIMTVTSSPARAGIPRMGGVGPAMSTVESITRGLSSELAAHNIRVVGLRPLGMPDSDTIREVYQLHADAWGMSWGQFRDLVASRTHAKRLSSLGEMAEMAALMASDSASGMTGTTVNLSLGSLDD